MRKLFAPAVLAGSLLMAAGLPAQAFAQAEPLSISTVGLTCTNGVCDLGTGNVGTFLNLAISATGGSGPTPFTWKRVSGKLPAGLSMAKFFGSNRPRSPAHRPRPPPPPSPSRSPTAPGP